MKPDENQNPVSLQVSPEQVTSSETQPVTSSTPTATPPQPTKSHKKLLITLVVFLVLLVAGGVGYALYHSKHTTKANAPTVTTKTTSSSSQSTVSAVTNTWTGKDNNYDWNDANNWSLGIPKNNQNLEINVANIQLPASGATFTFQDNIPNLTINKLVIDGQSSSTVGFNIKGDTLTVSNGIEDTATATNAVSYSTEIQVDNQINIGGNSTIATTGHNMLTFYSANTANSGELINLGTNTLQFTTTGTSQIAVSGAIAGTGEILIPNNAVASGSSVLFYNASPNFNGKVLVGSGDSVGMSNQANSTGGSSTSDAFGSSSITITNGGALSIFAAGASSFSVSNPITVSGNGVTQSNGSVSGAISACVTSAEEGCGSSESVAFTGQVKLSGNTQIGESTPSNLGANNTHVGYTFSNLDKNGYILNTVTDYYYSAEF